MPLLITNSAIIGGKNRNEFADDVLNILKRKQVTFRGCEPSHVTVWMDGKVKVWFYGQIERKPWVGGISFNCVRPEDRVFMTDPAVVAEMCRTHIGLMKAD